jgi:hypothetical protein
MPNILTTSTSQLQVTVATGTSGASVAVTNMTYVPQPGGGRQILLYLTTTASGGAQVAAVATITVYDDAFEENNIFGAPKGGAGQSQQGAAI